MYINNAIEIAMRLGKGIQRLKWANENNHIYLIPTNTPAGMVMGGRKREERQKDPIYGWQPRANDLIADDWEVI